MAKKLLIILFLSLSLCLSAQITLTHNVGTIPIGTGMPNCEYEEHWARAFTLSDFGIAKADQFIIRSGQVAISKSYEGARIGISVYSIDSNFPTSKPIYLGNGAFVETPYIDGVPQIIQIEFNEPIVVPAGVERILVVASQSEDFYDPDYTDIIIAGTEEDDDVSWFAGCREYYDYTTTDKLNEPVPNANFYINVTGDVLKSSSFGSTVRLTHNVCDDIIETNIHSCSSSYIYWARAFNLDDFGISTEEEFIISSGQVGINKTGWLPEISFNIYKIDSNFPASFSETDLIGSSQYQELSPNISRNSQIIQVDFDTPIVIPAGVERILVEVHKGIVYGDGVAFIAGSTQDNDTSWQRGCTRVVGGPSFGFDEYVSTADFGRPNANFYINVTGNVKHVTNNFEMNISNICSEFLKEFSVEDKANIASVIWDFGDPASGIDNTSTGLSPFHDFSMDGTYTITATVTGKNGSVEVLTETIAVKEPPTAYGINDVYACEDNFNSGISSTFNLSKVEQQVLGGQTDKVITYIDGSGKAYKNLPNLFTNTVSDRETIIVRVAHKNNACCYSETTFYLIVNPLPNLNAVSNLNECDDDSDGYEFFNLQQIKTNIIRTQTNIQVAFYHQNGQQILPPLNAVKNALVNGELITVRAKNSDTDCFTESTFKLIVNPLPIANTLQELIGCDDNNDGISEYFDTSNVESQVLGNQTGMEVAYFDAVGNPLPSPLPNPFTNMVANQERVIVRVTNSATKCYAETALVLKTASQPQINKPQTLYSCDEGNGFSSFDTSLIQSQLIGNQNGLKIMYFDINGNTLPSPLPKSFKNRTAWYQTINVKVENELNSLCYSETSFDLIVNELPKATIENIYFLCNLEPYLYVNVEANFDSYVWEYEDGTIVSNTFEVNLVNAGAYVLTIGENKNNMYCENSFDFKLIRSELPSITDIKYKELSDANFIEIITTGDGDFEYSIDGINYQNSSMFNNMLGGIYNVSVRDKSGCGEDFDKVTIIDYPKYFTPNNDGINDFWHIKGIPDYPNAIVFIYDRYGKLIKQISSNSSGWDGTFNNKKMSATDYWFTVNLDNENKFTGHFTLKR